jgi:hypothetical protein
MRPPRILQTRTALLAAGATVAAVFAAAALASVPGLGFAGKSSATDSSATKTASVACASAGKAVIGGAGRAKGPAGRVALNGIFPTGGGVQVSGAETGGGTASNWFTRAWAFCATGHPTPDWNVAYVVKDGPSDSTAEKSITAACGTGQKLIGSGGRVLAPSSDASKVLLYAITPLPDLSGVTAAAAERGGSTSDSWRVEAIAVCANPVPGLQLAKADTPVDSSSPKAATAKCPAGTKAIGAGGQLGGKAVALTAEIPLQHLAGVTARGSEIGGGTSGSWLLTAYAICATP